MRNDVDLKMSNLSSLHEFDVFGRIILWHKSSE